MFIQNSSDEICVPSIHRIVLEIQRRGTEKKERKFHQFMGGKCTRFKLRLAVFVNRIFICELIGVGNSGSHEIYTAGHAGIMKMKRDGRDQKRE